MDPELTIRKEVTGDCFVFGSGGELVAHAKPRPEAYDVWMPGPAGQRGAGSRVAEINVRRNHWEVEPAVGVEMVRAEDDDMTYDCIKDAVLGSVRAVLKARNSG